MGETQQCDINIDGFTEKNRQNFIAESNVHDILKKEKCWVGIDEAGRGPVLGKTKIFNHYLFIIMLDSS